MPQLARQARQFVVISGAMIAIIGAAAYIGARNRVRERASHRVVRALESSAANLGACLGGIGGDAWLLARHADAGDAVGLPGPTTRISADLLRFAESRTSYAQLRYIDDAGQERLRVDRRDGRAVAVPEAQLQDKSGRDYVVRGRALAAGQVYLSPLDLNVESGAIERPLRPMLRVVTPVFRGSNHAGMVVLNLDAAACLAAAGMGESGDGRPVDLEAHIAMTDTDGQWLVGMTPDTSWSGILPERAGHGLRDRQPGLWSAVAADPTSSFWYETDLYATQPLRLDALALGALADIEVRAENPRTHLLAKISDAQIAQQTWAAFLPIAAALPVVVLVLLVLLAIWIRGERRRMAVQERLEANEQRLRSMFRHAPVAILVVGRHGTITLASPQANELFGYHDGGLEGHSVDEMIPSDRRAQHVRYREAFVRENVARSMAGARALHAVRADGSEIEVAISLAPVELDGEPHTIAIVIDVSEQQRSSREIAALNNMLRGQMTEIELVNRELEAFSYSVSHDLRAPLRAIDGFSQALIEDCDDQLDAVARGYLGRIRSAAQRMGQLIDDLLELSRLTRAPVRRQPLNLALFAREIVDDLRAAEPTRAVDVRIEGDLRASGDPRMLRQAVQNLIENAWKYTAKRELATITFGATDDADGKRTFFVSDNGAGFDMEHAGKLFGAFQRLHSSSEYSGTGIGLATVRRILRKHGGDIWAESAVDAGATFSFTIPEPSHDAPETGNVSSGNHTEVSDA